MVKNIPYKGIFVFYVIAVALRFLAVKTPIYSSIDNPYLQILLRGIGPAAGAFIAIKTISYSRKPVFKRALPYAVSAISSLLGFPGDADRSRNLYSAWKLSDFIADYGTGVWLTGRNRVARIFTGTAERPAETFKYHGYSRFVVYLASQFCMYQFQYHISRDLIFGDLGNRQSVQQ